MSLKDNKPTVHYDSYHALIANVLKNYELQSPIPDEVQDLDKLRTLYQGGNWIPFSGYRNDSQDVLLKYLIKLATLTPTLSSCINSIGFYGFSGKIQFADDEDTEFDISNTKDVLSLTNDLGDTSKIAFRDKLKNINLNGLTWNKLSKSLFTSYKQTGNAYMLVTITKSMGKFYPALKFLKPQDCRYSIPKNLIDRRISVSPVWDKAYIDKYGYKEYPVYPLYSETKDAIHTIIHVKNGIDTFYGRPDWLACNLQAFSEAKGSEYLLKILHNDFMSLFILEMEAEEGQMLLDDADAQKSGYQDAVDRIEKHYTMKGNNPSSAIVMTRPPGATPFTMAQIPPNTKHQFYDFLFRSDKEYITMVNSWSLKLLGIDSSTGFNGQAFIDELLTKEGVLTNYQSVVDTGFLNTSLDFIAEKTGEPYNEYNLKQANPIDSIIRMQAKREILINQMKQVPVEPQNPSPDNRPDNNESEEEENMIMHSTEEKGQLWHAKIETAKRLLDKNRMQ